MEVKGLVFFPGLILAIVIVVHYFVWKLGRYPKRFAENVKTNQLWLMVALGVYMLAAEFILKK